MPKPKAAKSKPKPAAPPKPADPALPAVGSTLYYVFDDAPDRPDISLSMREFTVQAAYKKTVRIKAVGSSARKKFEPLTAQDLHDRGYRATPEAAKDAFLGVAMRAQMQATAHHQQAAHHMVRVSELVREIERALAGLPGASADRQKAMALAVEAAARFNDMGGDPEVTSVMNEAAADAAREPGTDKEYAAALDAQGCHVEDHGDDTFTLRTNRGGATALDSTDFSSALAEAWSLVKP